MDVGGVDVGGNEHLAVRPGLLRKLQCDPMGQLPGDRLRRVEGLDVVVEPDRAVLSVHLPGGGKLLGGQPGCAVLPVHQPAAILHVFLTLGDILRHSTQRPCGLFFIPDKGHRSHQCVSRSVSSRSLP